MVIHAVLLIFVISIVSVAQYSLYKIGVSIQPNAIVHGVISQLIVYSVFLVIAFSYLKKDFKKGMCCPDLRFSLGFLLVMFIVLTPVFL